MKLATRTDCRKVAGFTLIELLVVIAVVATLVGIVTPALSQSRHAARQVVCLTRLAQVARVLQVYELDYRGVFPRLQDPSYGTVTPSFDLGVGLDRTWVDLLSDHHYISASLATQGVPTEMTCPSALGYENDPTWAGHMPHFAANVFLNPPRRLEAQFGRRSFFGKPSQFAGDASSKLMLMESRHIDRDRGWYSAGNQRWIGPRHENGKSANAVYLDGRAALRRVEDAAMAATTIPTNTSAAFSELNFWSQEAR